MALEAGLKSAKERAAGLEALNEQLETARNEVRG